jgi:hypothetical protein
MLTRATHLSPRRRRVPLLRSGRRRVAAALSLLGLVSAGGGAQAPAVPASAGAAATPATPATVDAAAFGALRWLAGTWRGRMPDGRAFHERYAVVDDSTMTIAHLADSTLARVTGADTIALRGGTLRHGAAVAVRVDSASVAFVGDARARTGFTFTRAGAGWTADIHGRDRAGAPREVRYHMERVPDAAADREGVRRAVLDYVEGFYEGDTTKLARSVWPSVRKWGYARNAATGAYRGMAMAFPDGFMGFAHGVRAGRSTPPAGAPKDVVLYDVQDQTASAKLTAWWGTDYLLLARENGRWMITHVLWQSAPPRAAAAGGR